MDKYDSGFDVDAMIELQKRIVPELHKALIERYNILRLIYHYQPIGRRQLSSILEIGERIVRGEVLLLKEQELIEINAEGMKVTELGENILEGLNKYMHGFKGLKDVEEEIGKRLKIKKVIIVPSMFEDEEIILKEMGRAVSAYLKSMLQSHVVLGITGGSTMAAVAEEMGKEQGRFQNVVVVPARGGLGKDVDKQANTIAAKLASKLGSSYKLLYMPDNIDKAVLATMSEDPVIKDVMEHIEKIQVLVFGIGRADKMAIRRGLKPHEIQELQDKNAVSEAFGYYFDKKGNQVKEVSTIGMSLEQYKQLKHILGVASGKEKAEAIMAISCLNPNLVMVIDESLANQILKGNE